MAKLLGYIFSIAGLLGIGFYSVPSIQKYVPIPAQITGKFGATTILIASIALFIVGVYFLSRGGGGRSKQPAEVPIYAGKNVVGFRRMGKR